MNNKLLNEGHLTLAPMDLTTVHTKWDKIEHWLESSLDFSPDLKLADLKQLILKGQVTVIGVHRGQDTELQGAVAIQFKYSKAGKVALVLAIGGRWVCSAEGIGKLKEILRNLNVVKMQGIARPSVARLWERLGVKPLYTVMETDI